MSLQSDVPDLTPIEVSLALREFRIKRASEARYAPVREANDRLLAVQARVTELDKRLRFGWSLAGGWILRTENPIYPAYLRAIQERIEARNAARNAMADYHGVKRPAPLQPVRPFFARCAA